MTHNPTDRRAFIAGALAAMAALPIASEAPLAQPREAGLYYVELPPNTTLWGVATFFGGDPVEVSVMTPKRAKSVTGRFRKQRLVEHSWRNDGAQVERVAIRARASRLDGKTQELEATGIRFVGEQNCYVGFGRRYPSANLGEREGAYPYEAVFVGFILFGDQ